MEDIVEFNGKKYKKILAGRHNLCEGCTFLDKGEGPLSGVYSCKVANIDDSDRLLRCVAVTPMHSVQHFIFEELPE